MFFKQLSRKKSINRSRSLIEFLSNNSESYKEEIENANKSFFTGIKAKILNSEILAEIVLSGKEKKVRQIEKQLFTQEEGELSQQLTPEKVIKGKINQLKKKYPKRFIKEANDYCQKIYDMEEKNKKIYEKCQKLNTEIQKAFKSLSLKISELGDYFNNLSHNFKMIESVTEKVTRIKSFKEIEDRQKAQIGKEKDHSIISLNYDLLKGKLYMWAESYKKTAGYLNFFMDPYFEQNLNRFQSLEKKFEERLKLVLKKSKEETKLRLDSVVGIGSTGHNFDYHRARILECDEKIILANEYILKEYLKRNCLHISSSSNFVEQMCKYQIQDVKFNRNEWKKLYKKVLFLQGKGDVYNKASQKARAKRAQKVQNAQKRGVKEQAKSSNSNKFENQPVNQEISEIIQNGKQLPLNNRMSQSAVEINAKKKGVQSNAKIEWYFSPEH